MRLRELIIMAITAATLAAAVMPSPAAAQAPVAAQASSSEADPGAPETSAPHAASSPAPQEGDGPPVALPELPPLDRTPEQLAASGKLASFEGLSTWIDLYDVRGSPEEQVRHAADAGVQTILTQTARYNSPVDIVSPDRYGQLLEAAHGRDLKVVAWYLPDLVDMKRDLRRSKAAVDFASPRGDRADAFGMDIERTDVRDVGERNRRLISLSKDLRAAVGTSYPMAAIVLPPLQLDMTPSLWPRFPYRQMAASYDVIVPMSYSSFRGDDPETTYRWNHDNVVETRSRAGGGDVAVHLAGGIANGLSDVDAFVRAARDSGALGGGLYDLATTPASSWSGLRALRRSR